MSWLSKAAGAVGGAVKGATGGVANLASGGVRFIGRSASTVGSLGGSALRTASRVPGVSSSLVVITGGAAALNSNVRASAAKEFATGAAVGTAIGGAQALSAAKSSAPATLASAEAARTPTTSVGDLEAIDAAAARSSATSGGAARPVNLAGIGADPLLLVAGAAVAGLVIWGATRR